MRAHGTRARYVHGPGPGQDPTQGCRCEPCCEANRAYARYQAKRKRLAPLARTEGPWAPPIVDAAPTRAHILALGDRGVGYRRVAELAGVSATSLLEVRTGQQTRCRREFADAVQAVPLDVDLAAHQRVDAAPTWKLVNQILRRPGWTKARLSAEIGQGGRALQLGRRRVTVRSALAVAAIADRLGIDTDRADSGRRFPVDPLLAHAANISDLARRTGFDARSWHRWKHTGISARRADAAAVALGIHPAELWADWYAADDAGVAS